MSAAVNSGSEATKRSPTERLGLLAASARNYLPRFLSSLAMGAVMGVDLGWGWTVVWLAGVWGSLYLGIRLLEATARGASIPARWFTANSLFATCLQCAPAIALWRTGQPTAQGFAVAATFIGATYILLQYYADVVQFRILMAPYVAALAYMGVAMVAAQHATPVAIIAFAAAALSVGNFLHFSRRQLDRSRAALRQARAEAQEKEQAAEAANAAKSTFLATMSHEIRTPLNGVLGMAQAMAADRLSAVQRERLGVVHRSGEALLAILNDVLDLSKIEAGKLELESIEFDLGEVVRGTYSAFTALANKKGLSFALDAEHARGRYRGDPTRLRQILYNLISNALKFTEHGEIRVTATYDGERLEMTVADTGVGISAENLGRLFGKFDQLDSSTTRRFGGTGLGLSICRQLAELMGGDIGVTSEVGKGSAFVVGLPLPRIGEEKPASHLGPPPAPDLPDAPLRVLAAEDNAVNQLVLKTLLHQLGVEPTVVENGQAALDAWQRADWDLILMDIQMPIMDGLTATARIREIERTTGRPRTPIVALTANAMSHQVRQYQAAGMDSHVAKPIEAAALFQALSDATAEPPDAEGTRVA